MAGEKLREIVKDGKNHDSEVLVSMAGLFTIYKVI
jgi:hypothetical protein